MNYFSRPGIALTETAIIEQINQVFNLQNRDWIKTRSRLQVYVVPRFLLMHCLIKYMGYTTSQAGEYCSRDHCSAIHAGKKINNTYRHDSVYGYPVRTVLAECERSKSILR